jgi:hypothetical protein
VAFDTPPLRGSHSAVSQQDLKIYVQGFSPAHTRPLELEFVVVGDTTYH